MMFAQGDVSTAIGVAKKSIQDWEAHAFDHRSELIIQQNELMNETELLEEAAELTKSKGCFDDPMWRDGDGDGCEIYKYTIESGKLTREIACNGGGLQDTPGTGSLRGSRRVRVVADTTAKVFCRATCGMC